MQVRKGEAGKNWFRGDRFFHTNEGWYFSTREHFQHGPFSDKRDAVSELNLYIRQQNRDLYPGRLG